MQASNLIKLFLISAGLLTSCVTTSQKEAMENDIRQLENEINKLQERVATQLKQMDRTTKATLSSRNDLQGLQTQIQDNAGEVDSLKLRLKKIEEISAANSDRYNAKIAENEQTIITLQRKVAKLELLVPEPTAPHTTQPFKKN